MFDALLICITAFGTGFAAAWALGSRTREQLADVRARADEQALAAAEKLELVADTKSSLANAFKALSAEALNTNNQSFLQLATASLEKFQERAQGDLEARQKAVDALVQPIRESLEKVDGKLGEIEKTRQSAYSALNEQLRGLVETHLPMLRSETSNLVKALRQPNVRGRWGEMQLKRVVEMAGMLDHCDFVEQQSGASEDGRLRPDLIVKLPGGKQIVIDAKAPIAAYLEAAEATDDDAARGAPRAARAASARAHDRARPQGVLGHVQPDAGVRGHVPARRDVLQRGARRAIRQLIEFGVNEKVVPATPTTLIALLRAVAYGWRQEALALNAQEVADLGKQLYERIASLAAHWSDVGDKLERGRGLVQQERRRARVPRARHGPEARRAQGRAGRRRDRSVAPGRGAAAHAAGAGARGRASRAARSSASLASSSSTSARAQAARFTIPVAMFGLSGFTSTERSRGLTTRSISSMATAPSSTSSPSTSAPMNPVRFLKRTSSGPT